MTNFTRGLVLILVPTVLTVLAGCGGAGSSAVAPTVAPATPTATVAPTPTPDLRAIAAQQYLAAVTTYNVANDAFNSALKKIPNTAAWSAEVPAMRGLYHAETAFVQALFAIQFPPTMTADASAMATAENSLLAAESAFIGSPGQATADTYGTADTATSSASNAVRRDLGLPPVPLGTP